jgi:hypothetical protein
MNPPTLATALLRHLGPNDNSIAGDLIESFGKNGSRRWYWCQTLAAVASHFQTDVRTHPFRATWVTLFGWLCVWTASNYVPFLVGLDQHLFETGLNRWIYLHGYGLPTWTREFPVLALWKASAFAVGGYAVGRTRHGSSLVLFEIAVIVASAVTFIDQLQSPHPYPLTQLIIDLLVLYPCAALLGGIAAKRQRSVNRAIPC